MGESRSTLEAVKDSLAMYGSVMMAVEDESVGLGRVAEMLTAHFERAIEARRRGEPLAWTNFGVPPEIFWAMDVVPVVVDVVTGLVAPTPDSARYIDLAEQSIPGHICSNNKVLLGAMLSGDAAPPDFIVHPAAPCDSNLATYPVMAEVFGTSFFCIDMPYIKNEAGLRYIAGELGRLVSLLEEKTGRRLDLDRLREAMAHSNRAHEIYLELSKLRQAVPCPCMGLDTLAEYPAVLTMAGRPELVDYLEDRYTKTKAKVDRGEGWLTAEEEKHRLVWIYGAPAFDLFTFMWLEQEHGAVSVANMNSNFVMRPVEDLSGLEPILLGLADKLTLLPMTRECSGPWENYIDATLDLCTRFKADVAVFAGHVACKANWAITKLVKDRIRDELGIPTLVIELDLFDERFLSPEGIQARFDEFFSTVARR